MPKLGELQVPEDHLALFVFGPGYGEAILVWVPDEGWILLDSFTPPSGNAVPLDLMAPPEPLRGLILTHPHEDHCSRLEDFVPRVTDWIGCGEFWVERPEAWENDPDPEVFFRRSAAEAALAAIQNAWAMDPKKEWRLVAGESRNLGAARLTALHPDHQLIQLVRKGSIPGDLNRYSTPLLLEWHAVRILLGADLVKPEWSRVAGALSGPPLCEHRVYKVAHHGSRGALDTGVHGGSDPERIWIVTPFQRGPCPPRYETGEGIELMLQYVKELHATSVPVQDRPALQRLGRRPRRQEIDAALTLPSIPGTRAHRVRARDWPVDEAWVAVSFSRTGDKGIHEIGPVAVVVTA